jgi:DNA polymerase (family 10)
MPVHDADIAAVFGEIADLHDGIGQSRRGWLEKADVLNTRTLATLRPLLARPM